LATIALGVMAVGIYAYRRKGDHGSLKVDGPHARRDLRFFLLGYSLAAIAALIPSTPPLFHPDTPLEWLKLAIGVFLVPLYGFYLWRVLRDPQRALGTEARVERLQLSFLGHRRDGEPTTFAIAVQVAVALALMIGAAQLFVNAVTEVSGTVGVSASILSLLLAPLATELPEKFNSLIWIRQRKDTLAFANISGAMVFQGCIPVTVGILLTDWHFHFDRMDDRLRLLSVALALIGATITLSTLRKNEIRLPVLVAGAVLYAGFLVAVLASYLV
ncbi:MAG: sodium:calcium antiporter, partial [Thermoplasmatota archaeon]